MTTEPDIAGEIVKAQAPARRTATDLVESMRGELAKALPKHLTIDSFLRLALTELRMNPQLGDCSQESLLGALMTAARLGLEPGGPLGQFYLTPRRLKDQGKVVVPIVGYQGLRDLAYRSGVVRSVDSIIVREGDLYEEGANESRGHWFDWKPAAVGGSERPVVGVIGVAELAEGGRVFRQLDMREVLGRKDRGAAGDRGPWSSDFEAMVRKTGIRALAPLLPKSTAFAIATRVDEQVQVYNPGDPQWTTPTDDPGDEADR